MGKGGMNNSSHLLTGTPTAPQEHGELNSVFPLFHFSICTHRGTWFNHTTNHVTIT